MRSEEGSNGGIRWFKLWCEATIVDIVHPAPQTCGAAASFGNPIYPLTGIKREVMSLGEGLMLAAGRLPLSLAYQSTSRALVGASGARPAAIASPLGPKWTHSLQRRVVVQGGGRGVLVSRGDGRVISFLSNDVGGYTSHADVADRLIPSFSGWTYLDAAAQSIESYDSNGLLTAVAWASGETLALSYSTAATPSSIAPAPGYLIQAQDQLGRITQLTYQLPAGAEPATGGLLAAITDPAGRSVSLGYSAGNLSSLTWADGKQRVFHYEAPALPQALTGVTDEAGVRYSRFAYDSEGRAISTEHAGGLNRFSVSYGTPPQIVVSEVYDSAANILYRYHDWQAPQGTVVTTPTGASAALSATTLNGNSYLTSQSQPAGSGCTASTSASAYDAQGNLASRDDFTGNRVCYANDTARNLPITRVEGLAKTASCSAVLPANAALPSGSRKTTTTWHPDWRIPVQVAEPGRITTSVYNGQPDPFAGGTASCAPAEAVLPAGKPIAVLCKQVEQATTDTTGRLGLAATLQAGVTARTRQWSYNANGQILTESDPLNRTSTYAYWSDTTTGTPSHSRGDLKSVTNPLGQVTNFTQYNPLGQLLRSTDPNGVATTYSYDQRGRLLSTSIGGQASSYGYDAAGQLTSSTRADGSSLGYEYDAAHRLRAVKDSRGNRIEYTVDNAAAITAQQVKDPTGSLVRALTQTRDALGRVQQTIGKP